MRNYSNQSRILESLNNGRRMVNEASVFKGPLDAFLSVEDKNIQDFVRKALNTMFVGIKNDFGGYIEGKKPIVKDLGAYRTFTMKIQALKEGSNGSDWEWKLTEKYWKSLGILDDNYKIDGSYYYVVIPKDIKISADPKVDYTDLSKNIVVGVKKIGTGVSSSSRYKTMDKSIDGSTYKFIISLPTYNEIDYNNPYLHKRGTEYVFANGYKDSVGYTYSIVYRENTNEFKFYKSREGDYDGFNVLYKSSRNSRKAFDELARTFNKNTTMEEAESVLEKYKVRLGTSYWFNPYTD